jgi:hypothetical protein
MKRTIITAAAAAAVLAGSAVAAAPAMASNVPGQVFAVTHSPQHNDTTSGPTNPPVGALQASPGGPVWAIDNLTEQFTATPAGPGQWKVAVSITGSFAGFADPGRDGSTDPASGYGQPLISNGPVRGSITYLVTTNGTPSGANLLPNQAPDTGLGAAIRQLFNDPSAQLTQVGDYSFNYQNGNYVQAAGITGDVRGH